jgi:hypothetical protein
MVTPTSAGEDFKQMLKEWGKPVRFRYFTTTLVSAGSAYDDDLTLATSGSDLWISGVVNPIDATRGSRDGVLVEQGRLKVDDQALYVAGSIQTSGAFRVGLGSPIIGEYRMVPEGVIAWETQGTEVYKKVYLRYLTTGSLHGE